MRNQKSSRRNFIKCAAAIAGFPTLISSAALGRSEIPPSSRIAVGIIGTGGQGGYHAGNYHRLGEQAEVVFWNPENESIVGDDEAIKLMSRSMRAPWSLS